MPVTVPSLDDLGYPQLLAEVTARIPGLDPGWTDLSPTEPGMVLLELLCWLTESAIWRLDQVSPAVVGAMLQLLDPQRIARLTPAAGDTAGLDATIAGLREQLRTPHRAVTVDDYQRLLAARWPARRFVIRPGERVTDVVRDAPGHVSVIGAPATYHRVGRVRLIPGGRAWVITIDSPGVVRVELRAAEDRVIAIVDGASAAECAAGGPWILAEEPADLMGRRNFTLTGPEGRQRATVALAAADAWTLSLTAAGRTLVERVSADPAEPGTARCSLVCAPEWQVRTRIVQLWPASAVTVKVDEWAPQSLAPGRGYIDHSGAIAGESPELPVLVTLTRPVELVVAVERREFVADLPGELRELLAPRVPLGTRLRLPEPTAAPLSVSATLFLRAGADPGAVHSAAVAALERHFRGLDGAGLDAVGREVSATAVFALLAGIDGVARVTRGSNEQLVSRIDVPDAPTRAADDVDATWQPRLDVVRLGPCELATLASPVELDLRRQRSTGGWERVTP